MPSQQEVKWSQLKIGVIVIVAIALLTLLLFLMTSASGMGIFSKKIVVTTYFENASGIKPGGAATLQGVTIGEVKKVLVSTDPARRLTPVEVIMRLDPKYHASLRKDSRAALSTVGVLGDTVVDINSQVATGPELQDGDELKTLESPSLQDVVKASQGTVESLNVILAKVNRIVDNLQTGQGSAGKLLNDPALYNKTTDTVEQLHRLTVKLNSGQGSLGKLLNDDTLFRDAQTVMKKANTAIDGLGDSGPITALGVVAGSLF